MSGGSLAARRIWIDPQRSIQNAEVVWDGSGRIVALRRTRGRVRDVVLVPGLVDAHAHLQLEPLPATAPRDFLPWVGAVMKQRAATAPAGMRAAARAHVKALQRDGVTAFGEIDSTGLSPAVLRAAGAAGRCYQELTGFHLTGAAARQLVQNRRVVGDGRLAAGLSPHAPYSVSGDLMRAAARRCRHLSIHCAEVPEEQQFLRTGEGPFAELLAALGRLPAGFRAPGVGAVRHLQRLGVLRPGTHLVHCQELERGDVARIRDAGAAIVVCPGTIEWFGREVPPVARWLAAGVPVAIGTDSRASNARWSLRGELALLGRMCPALSDRQLLTIATSHGAQALGRPGLGRLRRGGRADLLALPAHDGDDDALLGAFVRGELAPALVLSAGRRIR
ncbi:MAG: amidohydrolase family protein [Planctomycetes bacterium]|nr:amidohydrolase family protein [Planctomycetota bacterium]MCB9887900.1 amidohydrolase family protein [Planctomycetota bacterium]